MLMRLLPSHDWTVGLFGRCDGTAGCWPLWPVRRLGR